MLLIVRVSTKKNTISVEIFAVSLRIYNCTNFIILREKFKTLRDDGASRKPRMLVCSTFITHLFNLLIRPFFQNLARFFLGFMTNSRAAGPSRAEAAQLITIYRKKIYVPLQTPIIRSSRLYMEHRNGSRTNPPNKCSSSSSLRYFIKLYFASVN